MFNFYFYNPTKITFGAGTIDRVGEIAAQWGEKAIILTGQSHASKYGLRDKILTLLKDAGINSLSISGVTPNPKLNTLQKMAEDVRGFSADFIIAVGGGSVMDAAKIISLILTHDGDPWEYRVTGSLSVPGITNDLLPVITIPTTAGTGSEASPAALVNHDGRKEVYFSPFMYPRETIIDPVLSTTLSADLTAQIGMDAFVQSLEAYVSINAQPFSDMFAVKSMQLVLQYLPSLVNHLDDIFLRSQLSLAGLLSLYAIGQAGVGAVHALSDPISGHYDVGHGLALSILLPSVVRANFDANLEKFASLAEVFGINTDGENLAESVDAVVKVIEKLIEDVGLADYRLGQFGISEKDFPVFAKEADNPDMSTNPKKLSPEQIIQIYRQVL